MAIIRRVEENREEARYLLWLAESEFDLIRSLPSRLRSLLEDPAQAPRVIDRLFPPAHKDPGEESELRKLIGKSLYETRLTALESFRKSLQQATRNRSLYRVLLEESQMHLWLHVINDMRLLLGTELDIQDNEWQLKGPGSPADQESFMMLINLTNLQQVVIDALAGAEPA